MKKLNEVVCLTGVRSLSRFCTRDSGKWEAGLSWPEIQEGTICALFFFLDHFEFRKWLTVGFSGNNKEF